MRKLMRKVTAAIRFREIWEHFAKVQEMTEIAVSRTSEQHAHTQISTILLILSYPHKESS